MNEQVYDDDEREVDIKDLLLHVFVKWKVLLLCAVIGAALVVGGRYAKYAIERYVNVDSYNAAVKEYQDALDDYQSKVDSYNEAIESYQSQLNDTTAPGDIVSIQNSITSAEKTRDDLTAPEEPSILKDEPTVKGYVKTGIIGALIFFFLGAIWFVIRYLTDNKVHDGNEIRDMYHIRKFDVIHSHKKKDNKEEYFGMLSALIDNLNAKKTDVLLTGPVSYKLLETYSDALKKVEQKYGYVPIEKITEEPDSLRKASQYKTAVLVVKKEKTKLNDVEKLLDYLDTANVEVLGYIVA